MRNWIKAIGLVMIIFGVGLLGLFTVDGPNLGYEGKGAFAFVASSGIFRTLGFVLVIIGAGLLFLVRFLRE